MDALPNEVREEAIGALSALQDGQRPPAGRYKDLTGNDKLAGIGEIRLSHDGDTYRVYNVVTYREVLYVLEAGIKKSMRGGAIPQQDVKRLEARFKRAKEDYETKKAAYQAGYEERARRRTTNLFARGEFNHRRRVEDPAGKVLDQDFVPRFGEFTGLGDSLLRGGNDNPDGTVAVFRIHLISYVAHRPLADADFLTPFQIGG
ncbi:type II toxin-antitoxin system RelE/ParE family toxin [Bradyrhizobium brasilense]|uniref:type II toxin-antitoxin system RelE/ParE family toxin n=1 Tax=Bradyrhizobium brasilense TaxID=1419277 RepID=UPI00237AEC7B|nr:type II toxin-antitoxin system RelE/ParE family toxin [Bradyrhizobium brasilense]